MPMPLRRTVPLVLATALATACAGDPAALDARLSSYVGRSETDLVTGLGVPSRAYEADGRRFLQYDAVGAGSGVAVFPSIGFGFGSFGGSTAFGTGVGLGFAGPARPADPCTVIFELQGSRVATYSRRGAGCATATL